MTLNELVKNAWQNSENKGFHAIETTFGDRLMLVVSELSEALEDYRRGYSPSEHKYFEVGDNSTHKPVGIPSEIADVVIRIADLCGVYGIDLEKAVTEKMEFNATRPHLHGGKKL